MADEVYDEDLDPIVGRLAFTVKVTAAATAAGDHVGTQQQMSGTGALIDQPEGLRFGDPPLTRLAERNGATLTTLPVFVEARVRGNAFGSVYEFDAPAGTAGGGGGALTVQEKDGAPSFAGVTLLQFDQATGLTLSGSGTTAIAALQMATVSLPGGVSVGKIGRAHV